MYFDHIHYTSPISSQIHSHLPTPPNFTVFLKKPWTPICAAQTLLGIGSTPKSGKPPGTTFLKKKKKKKLSVSQQHPLPIAPQLRVAPCVHLPMKHYVIF